jgi:glycosyltransferase involved in cell wall biosynthesis
VSESAPLLFLSRLDRIKGAHTAIEIARRAGRRLIIAGNHAESGSEFDYWKQEVEPAIGRDGIEYVGPVDDVAKNGLLGESAAMIVPIEWEEPFGIVFAEALACGTPVISRARGALPEIVTPGRHGFLIDSVEDGVEAVRRLGSISRAACRERAESAFSADVIVDQYLELYRRRVGESSGRVGQQAQCALF